MESKRFLENQYDRVYITSLFTFYYSQTIKTIKSYEKLISPEKIFIGGIMVSLLTEKIKGDIDDRVTILTGLLSDSCVLKLGDSVNIDILPLDYSILDDIVYKYPAGDNYFAGKLWVLGNYKMPNDMIHAIPENTFGDCAPIHKVLYFIQRILRGIRLLHSNRQSAGELPEIYFIIAEFLQN